MRRRAARTHQLFRTVSTVSGSSVAPGMQYAGMADGLTGWLRQLPMAAVAEERRAGGPKAEVVARFNGALA